MSVLMVSLTSYSCVSAHLLNVKEIESGEVDLWVKSLSPKHGDLSSVLSTKC